MSRPANVAAIRAHLLGSNTLVGGVDRFVKTTPPGPGSGRVRLDDGDPVLAGYSIPAGRGVRLMHVGTYEASGIGTSCYHADLAILENLLSHMVLLSGEWVVCDMVAGTDAFSNSLHAQFDLIVMVVEPTPESAAVAVRYRDLAVAAGVGDGVVFVANKVADAADRQWLRQALGTPALTELGALDGLRRARQQGRTPVPNDLPDLAPLDPIVDAARNSPLDGDRRAGLLRELHLRLAEEDWVRAAHGDVTGQFSPAGA